MIFVLFVFSLPIHRLAKTRIAVFPSSPSPTEKSTGRWNPTPTQHNTTQHNITKHFGRATRTLTPFPVTSLDHTAKFLGFPHLVRQSWIHRRQPTKSSLLSLRRRPSYLPLPTQPTRVLHNNLHLPDNQAPRPRRLPTAPTVLIVHHQPTLPALQTPSNGLPTSAGPAANNSKENVI